MTSRTGLSVAHTLLAVLLVLALTGCVTSTGSDAPDPVGGQTSVTTSLGPIDGVRDGEVLRFDGIPYAQAPVGARRFAPPVAVEPWRDPVVADDSGPTCAQLDGTGTVVGSEDCLRLDITAPAAPSPTARPVMVWLHGGGFTQGSGASHDPARFVARGDVIVVTLNYRLGALGFVGLPGLPGSGAFGLADQQQALRFVRTVAPAFGGDPDAVTLFGESAGASSVCYHLTAPGTVGLFHRAILQSAIECGAPTPPHPYGLPRPDTEGQTLPPELATVERDGAAAAAAAGCVRDVVSCVRDLPLDQVMTWHTRFARPAIGTEQVPAPPWERLADVTVPVLAGFNRDESRFYAALETLLGRPMAEGTYVPAIRRSFGDRADAVLDRYPRPEFGSDAEAWSAVYTDATFACPQLHANAVMAQHAPVWAYTFADRSAPPPLPMLPGAPPPGASHSAELPYLFDMAGQPLDLQGNHIPLTGPQQAVAASMIDVWTDFAHGRPPAVDRWEAGRPALTFTSEKVELSDPSTVHQCDFWRANEEYR